MKLPYSLLMHVFYRSLVFSCLSAHFCLNLAGEDEGFLFFEKKIRPVFAQHCYECHSAKSEKLKANLLLDRKEGLDTRRRQRASDQSGKTGKQHVDEGDWIP